jgi:hypothetical protein
MSNQQRPPDEQRDSLVSAAYRDLAQERSPAHLDHVVLNEARETAKSSRGRGISWLRPTAWVTTIGLCLAIVLEVTDLVPQDDAMTGQPVVTENKEAEIEGPAMRQKRPALPASRDVKSLARDEVSTVPADSAVPEADEEALTDAPSDAFRSQATDPAGVESLGRSDTRMLRDAEERARAREGTAREGISPLSKAVQFGDLDSERYCNEDETATPEAWIGCIMRLQQDGRHEEARLEHDRLHETFPGAEIPPLTAPLPDSP